jgi:hypothetical protein
MHCTSRSSFHHLARLGVCLGAWLVAGTATVSAADSSTAAPAVVELFTSEGCNSCPPAEAVLGSLASRPDVIALAFHVTYWDSAGWRDMFGLPGAASRQRRYARSLQLSSAYTPQAVINGTLDVLGSNERGIGEAVARLPRPARVPGKRNDSAWVVRLPALSRACPCMLQLVSVRAVAVVSVHGGENAGRILREYRVVRSMRTARPWDGGESERTLPLEDLPGDATSVVVLAERLQDGAIVAVGELAL